jgi:hypothetical protein
MKEETKAESEIDKIIQAQAPNGSWSDLSLINKIGSNPSLIHQKVSEWGAELVLTHLVVLWIEKYHPKK